MAQKYAKGSRAWGICGRSGRKMLLKDMVFDGRYPDMRVDPEWKEDKHPQEYMPKVEDPTALWRPSPEVIAPPSAPVLTVSQLNETTVQVTWTPAETGITEIASYTIFRGVDGATPFPLVTCAVLRDFLGGITGVERCTTTPSIPADDTSDQPQPGDSSGSVFDKVTNEDAPVTYLDSAVSQGHTYCYYIVANPMGNNQSVGQGPPSSPSSTQCVTVQNIIATAPVLSVAIDADGVRADLSWTASTVLGSTIAHYELYRSDDGGTTFHLVHETDGVTLAYIDSPTPGAVYYWYVLAVPVLGLNSPNSNIVSLTISNDPLFQDVVLLLHFDGSNGQVTTTDSSNVHNVMTLFGSASLTTANPKFGTASFNQPDTSNSGGPISAVRTPILQNAPLDILSGTEDFTVEGWFMLTGGSVNSNFVIIDYGDDGVSFSGSGFDSGFLLTAVSSDGGATPGMFLSTAVKQNGTGAPWGGITGNPGTITKNVWYHFAVTRQSGIPKLFFNGIFLGQSLSGPWTNYVFPVTVSQVTVGNTGIIHGALAPAQVDEIRVTKGVARYTGNYTPPTAPSFP